MFIMRIAKKEKSIFSKQLIKLRQSRGLTQEQLASGLEITRDAVAYYENQAKNPGSESIQKLADFFGVDPGTLFTNEETKKTPGPASKIEKQLNAIRQLPKKDQRAISAVLDMALQQAKHA